MENNELSKELGTNFIEYAAAVNKDRSIPDAYSGLKPVARRILYAAYKSGFSSNKKYVKCAKIVGNVMGSYHPHGSSSIYDALVRLSRDWVMRYPLIDFYGNVGGITGDGAAAERYTEARLAKLSEDGLLIGLKKKVVPFAPNYDETTEEPITLPSIFPNLLCNPNEGIGVALACHWGCHNLKEVAQAICDYIEGKEPTLPGPDFPTGGEVINSSKMKEIMETGKGTIRIRARYKIEKQKIIFYEIPYGETIEGLINEVATLCDQEKITGIEDIHDESSDKIRIVVTCNKGVSPNIVVNNLFALTKFQNTFCYNMVALVNKTPTELNLKNCIQLYLEHNIQCLINECNFDLEKSKNRLEIVTGLLKALEDIDNIITLIKEAKNTAHAKERLKEKYGFSENQANAIVEMKLGRLAGLERMEIENEKTELEKTIEELTTILSSEDNQMSVIKQRLIDFAEKYGDDRRTILSDFSEDEIIKAKKKEEFVIEDTVVMITTKGFARRISLTEYRVQRKAKDKKLSNSPLIAICKGKTSEKITIFTNSGRMFFVDIKKIPAGIKNSDGVDLYGLIPFIEMNEKIINCFIFNENLKGKYVLMATKNGIIKKSKVEEYSKLIRNKTMALTLKEDDKLVDVKMINEESCLMVSKTGRILHIETEEIIARSRATKGVAGMDFSEIEEDDCVVALIPIMSKEYIIFVMSNGRVKKSNAKDFPIQARNGVGQRVGHLAAQGAKTTVLFAKQEEEDSYIFIKGKKSSSVVKAENIPIRNKRGEGLLAIIDEDIIDVGIS